MRWCFVGVDLGQSCDFTAIAVLERAVMKGPWDAVAFAYRKTTALRLRYLERVPLGTPYPMTADRLRQITRSGELAGRCHAIVDATGVGRPVVDRIRQSKPSANKRWRVTDSWRPRPSA